MSYKNNRPESRRGRVYSTFVSKGKDAAITLAQELGVKDQVIKYWFEKVFGDGVKTEITPRRNKRLAEKGRRVYHVGWTDMHGTIITEGDQVSAVLWDHGREGFASNDKLRNVKA